MLDFNKIVLSRSSSLVCWVLIGLLEEAESQRILVMGIPKVSIEELLDEKVATQLDMRARKLRATLEILPGGHLGIGSFKSAVRGRLTLEQ